MEDNLPNLVITIPNHLCEDFLGIFVLDVLHDSVKYGVLDGNRLSQLTDLITESFFYHNEINDNEEMVYLRNYIFISVLKYFSKLWENNMSEALGITQSDIENIGIQSLRDMTKIPVRRVADRPDHGVFIDPKGGYTSVELQNYNLQKEITNKSTNVDYQTFYSPSQPHFIKQAETIGLNILKKTNYNSKAVLDMKASAGLIRSISDQIGYITGLPTFADPGYNMPGMSEIREYSEKAFIIDSPNNVYKHTPNFKFQIQLDLGAEQPIVFFNTNYFYGSSKNGINRENMIICIMNELFHGSLPRSSVMAEAVGDYLNPELAEINENNSITDTIQDILLNFNSIIQDFYNKCNDLTEIKINSELIEWCGDCYFKQPYIQATMKNMIYFPSILIDDLDLFPNIMISEILPDIMTKFLEIEDLDLLAFSYHQLNLLKQYIGHDNISGMRYKFKLDNMLQNQLMPKRRKLIVQINKAMREKRKNDTNVYCEHANWIHDYIRKIVYMCKSNLEYILIDYDENNFNDILDLLNKVPEFNPPPDLKQLLSINSRFYHPDLHYNTNQSQDGLLIYTLLESLLPTPLYPTPLLKLPFLKTKISTFSIPSFNQVSVNALTKLLGKFSGDFGQLMWAINKGHLFTTEDNNASAMALFFHRIPIHCIQNLDRQYRIWGNIHGLGNGGSVDIFISS